MDIDSLLGLTSGTTGLESLDTSLISSWLAMSMWVTVAITVALIAWYVYRAIRKAKQRHEDDLKLRSYFDKYSEEVADKVVAKLKHENLVMVDPTPSPKTVLGILPKQIIFTEQNEKKENS